MCFWDEGLLSKKIASPSPVAPLTLHFRGGGGEGKNFAHFARIFGHFKDHWKTYCLPQIKFLDPPLKTYTSFQAS